MMKKIAVFGAVSAALLSWSLPSQARAVLDAVKSRGFVQCGVNTSAPGFASADSQGKWKGLDVNVCRAVAAAVLGDSEKVKYIPLNSPQRFTALQSGEIDILAQQEIENSASPRNPKVAIFARSLYSLSFDVVCRRHATSRSDLFMPQPSSVTRMSVYPPFSIEIVIDLAFASIAFSRSSFTTFEGWWMTSPAAILRMIESSSFSIAGASI